MNMREQQSSCCGRHKISKKIRAAKNQPRPCLASRKLLCREKQIHAMANSQRRIKKSQHQSKQSRTEEPYDGKGTTQSVELGSWLRAPLKETAVERQGTDCASYTSRCRAHKREADQTGTKTKMSTGGRNLHTGTASSPLWRAES
jgi:hypothetical protein